MDLRKIVEKRLDDKNAQWFQDAMKKIEGDFSTREFLRCFAQAGRYLKAVPVSLSGEEMKSLQEAKLEFSSWSLDEMGRAQMLFACAKKAQFCDLVKNCYRFGDNREQAAILKSLWLLPDNEHYLPLALDALRTNITPIFAALACDNPYPAARFNEQNFNNMVLKTIFMDLPLLRILGLDERKNPRLAQMANDWIDEREAASRAVTPEVWAIVSSFAKGKYLDRVYRYLRCDDVRHRLQVADSLQKTDNHRQKGEVT